MINQGASLWNIILVGVANLLILVTFMTGNAIQEVIVASINEDYHEKWKGYQWNGFTSLGIMGTSFTILCWFAPSIIAAVNVKRSFILVGTVFCLSFSVFLYPFKYGLILASLGTGLGDSVIWTAQGNYLAIMSRKEELKRNTGILWSLSLASSLLGNLIVSLLFSNKEHIDSRTRMITYSVLIGCSIIGTSMMFLIRGPKQEELVVEQKTPYEAFRSALKLFKTKKMLILSVLFLYVGMEVSFITSVYTASIAFTKSFGINRKTYSGIAGALIGLGEVIGGIIFILTSKRSRPKIMIVIGYGLSVIAFILIFINLPNASSMHETDEQSILSSNLPVALFCALVMGLSDGCIQTQMYEYIAATYSTKSAEAFALYQFLQGFATSTMFYCSNLIGLHIHSLILTCFSTIGIITFFVADRLPHSEQEQ